MLTAINVKQSLDLNLAAAIILAVATVFVMALLVYFLIFANKDKAKPGQNPSKSKNNGYGHCDLNDIMGYDFVQVKTPQLAVPQPVVNEKTQRFTDSQGIGMTDRPVSTTGAKPKGYDDEPEITPEQQKKNAEQQKKNEEFERRAREEQKTEVTEEFIAAIGAAENAPWPEYNETIERRKAFENMLNDGKFDDMLDENYDEDENEDESFESGNNLASEPQEATLYNDNLNQMYDMIEEIKEASNKFTDEQEEILSELDIDD